jgi:chloramphenicol O-acetyltransferase type A
MTHIIDIDAWERRDNYNFFRTFVNSWYSVTTEIDCTEARAAAKASGRSFFLCYLYAVLRSANEVDALRYRTDKNGQVIFHDQVDIISPIAVPGKAQQGIYDVVHLSAVPKMYFTSTTYTLAEAGNACSYPLMTAGKAVTREGRLVFPLSIYVNHAFVDGSHLATFFEKIEKYLKEISHE